MLARTYPDVCILNRHLTLYSSIFYLSNFLFQKKFQFTLLGHGDPTLIYNFHDIHADEWNVLIQKFMDPSKPNAKIFLPMLRFNMGRQDNPYWNLLVIYRFIF
jgi:hypothetical protein